jgi:hypothetical protein
MITGSLWSTWISTDKRRVNMFECKTHPIIEIQRRMLLGEGAMPPSHDRLGEGSRSFAGVGIGYSLERRGGFAEKWFGQRGLAVPEGHGESLSLLQLRRVEYVL